MKEGFEIVSVTGSGRQELPVPAVVGDAGDQAVYRFIEFFTANIRNRSHGLGVCPDSRRAGAEGR